MRSDHFLLFLCSIIIVSHSCIFSMEMQEYKCQQISVANSGQVELMCCAGGKDQFFTDLKEAQVAGNRKFSEMTFEKDFKKECFFDKQKQKLTIKGSFIKGFFYTSGLYQKWKTLVENEISINDIQAETLLENFWKRYRSVAVPYIPYGFFRSRRCFQQSIYSRKN